MIKLISYQQVRHTGDRRGSVQYTLVQHSPGILLLYILLHVQAVQHNQTLHSTYNTRYSSSVVTHSCTVQAEQYNQTIHSTYNTGYSSSVHTPFCTGSAAQLGPSQYLQYRTQVFCTYSFDLHVLCRQSSTDRPSAVPTLQDIVLLYILLHVQAEQLSQFYSE